MTENDLMNQIHTVMMEWCREEDGCERGQQCVP
jgi:hypothetical protein